MLGILAAFRALKKGRYALTLISSYSADDEPGAECEREKEEDRSQQQNRVPQLTYHGIFSFLRFVARG